MLQSRTRRPAPIPGTEQPKRGLFVDRWGTLLEPSTLDASRLVEPTFQRGALEALAYACRAGWYVYLIGNEEAVARGEVSDATWKAFQDGLLAQLERSNVLLRRFYACLDLPEGVPAHRRKSIFQLPDTGVFFHACQEDGIDLKESWTIGDSTVELIAATRAGLKAAAVRTGLALNDRGYHLEPELSARDLNAAVRSIVLSRLA